MTLSDVAALATIISLPIAAGGVIYAALQTRLSRRVASASVTLTASEAFRDAWASMDVHSGDAEAHRAAFGDLLNLIEACCAVHRDKLLVGRSGALLDTYLVNTLTQIEQSAPARDLFADLVETDRTFEEIGHFLAAKRRERRDFLARLQTARH